MQKRYNRIIDFHTHAFPDEIANSVMTHLEEQADIPVYLDGRVSSLLGSMDSCGIQSSVLCCIATKPEQFESIFKWCKNIQSDRIIPFPSIHPDDKDYAQRLVRIKEAGFKGIKLHPYYQDFYIDEDRLWPIYEKIDELGLIVAMHCGFDFAYEHINRAGPNLIRKVIDRFESIKFVATHLGGWEQWADVRKYLMGQKIYMELSFSLDYLGAEGVKQIILNHPKEYVMFGTDSPWDNQPEVVRKFTELDLDKELEDMILRKNAEQLLGI
jgi:uncharacterized protein